MAKVVVTPSYQPHEKQVLLHNAPCSFEDICITLYGGSRGGGKSAGILADAFMFATTYPGAKCIIIREKLDAVKQSFLDKLPTLFPQKAGGQTIYEYREKSTSWYPSRSIIFPNGSYITLQRVADYREALSQQGWEFHYLAIDEVTKQDERTFNYLLSTVRSTIQTNPYTGEKLRIPTKVVLGCNPGGKGHKWVKRRFIDPTVTLYDPYTNAPIETKDHIEWMDTAKGKIKVITRFIPASYKDNPFLNASYAAMLEMQDEARKQMDLYGNWDVVAGRMFDVPEEQYINGREAYLELTKGPQNFDVYISIDWGYKPSYHSALWHAVFEDGRVITFDDMYGQDLIFEDFVRAIADKSKQMGYYITATLLPHDMYRGGDRYRDDTGRIIGEMKSEVFDYYGLNPIGVESGKGKVQMRYDKIHSSTRLKMIDGTHRFRISTSVNSLIEEMDNAVYDDFNIGMINKGCADHAIDSYGLFLVFYSSDIAPIGVEDFEEDTRTKWQRRLDEEEEKLSNGEIDSWGVAVEDDYF
jgi:phage terminase large subunit